MSRSDPFVGCICAKCGAEVSGSGDADDCFGCPGSESNPYLGMAADKLRRIFHDDPDPFVVRALAHEALDLLDRASSAPESSGWADFGAYARQSAAKLRRIFKDRPNRFVVRAIARETLDLLERGLGSCRAMDARGEAEPQAALDSLGMVSKEDRDL